MVLQAPGGRFANGLIPRQYAPGQDIVVKVKEMIKSKSSSNLLFYSILFHRIKHLRGINFEKKKKSAEIKREKIGEILFTKFRILYHTAQILTVFVLILLMGSKIEK